MLAAGAPVQLLLESCPPPDELGPVEDWIRVPSSDDDIEAVWPGDGSGAGGPRRNALDTQILNLRRRLREVGLTIRTVRSRGYILDPLDRSSVSN